MSSESWAYGPLRNQAEMPAATLAHYLRRLSHTNSVSALTKLAQEIVERFPGDEAALRLTCVIAVKAARLARTN